MVAHLNFPFIRRAAWLCVTLAMLSAGASGQSDELKVFSLTGEWHQAKTVSEAEAELRVLHWGQTIPSSPDSLYGAKDSMIVLKISKDKIFSVNCDTALKSGKSVKKTNSPWLPCEVSLKDVQEQAKLSQPYAFIRDIKDAFKRITSEQPEKYMIASSRGVDDEFTDAVVSLNGGQADLHEVFREMSSGKYYLKFSTVEAGASQPKPVPILYTKGQPVTVSANGLHEGLYKILLVDSNGEPAGSDAWILLAAPSGYATKSKAFQQAVDDSKKLPDEMDPAATRALLRGYLESLSRAQ